MKDIQELPQSKRAYVAPSIDKIELDNEISLIMESAASSSSCPELDPE